jgi:hypothetical protein
MVEKDRLTPAILSPEVSRYLMDLVVQHPDDGSDFSRFVAWLPFDAIRHELLRQLVPQNLRQTILALRARYDELQIKKENEIAAATFDDAVACRDRQERVAISIQEAIGDQTLVVTPKLIDSVLRILGYNGL